MPARKPLAAPAIPYAVAKAAYDALQAEWSAAGAALRAIPGAGSGPMGLTPDDVRARPDWRAAWNACQAAETACKGFLARTRFAKVYAREIKADIAARRAAKLAAHAQA